MNFKIVVDSCCDIPDEYRELECFEVVPLTLLVGDKEIVDDETIDTEALIETIAKSPTAPKSACPSPYQYMEAFKGGEAKNIYVVTLSSKLSGSYNSAQLAVNLYKEEFGEDKRITVFDSMSASSGEVILALRIYEMALAGKSHDEIKTDIENYAKGMGTYFVLESLDTLKKNGRLKGLTALIVSVLNIKPVMSSDGAGEIVKRDQSRGINNALSKMVKLIVDEGKNLKNKVLVIAHANCEERAKLVKEQISKLCEFKDILIIRTRGLSTMYANDKGIIVCI